MGKVLTSRKQKTLIQKHRTSSKNMLKYRYMFKYPPEAEPKHLQIESELISTHNHVRFLLSP